MLNNGTLKLYMSLSYGLTKIQVNILKYQMIKYGICLYMSYLCFDFPLFVEYKLCLQFQMC